MAADKNKARSGVSGKLLEIWQKADTSREFGQIKVGKKGSELDNKKPTMYGLGTWVK